MIFPFYLLLTMIPKILGKIHELVLHCPVQTHSYFFPLYPCPGRLTSIDFINGIPDPLTSCGVQPTGGARRRSENRSRERSWGYLFTCLPLYRLWLDYGCSIECHCFYCVTISGHSHNFSNSFLSLCLAISLSCPF